MWRRPTRVRIDLIVTNVTGSATSSNANLIIQSPSVVGEWLAGATNLTDVSGYSPAGTHDGYIVGTGHYLFTNDVPLGQARSIALLHQR